MGRCVRTYRLEGGRLALARRAVIHSHATVGGADGVVDHDGHALVRAVLGRLVVDVGGPVVGEVLLEGAAGALCDLGDVGHGHGRVEGILGTLCQRTVS